MSFENIFDIQDTSDVNDEYKKSLFVDGIKSDTKKVLELFNMKDELSIDQIGIALYRSHGIQKTRKWILATLNNLMRREFIASTGQRGIYRKLS